MRSSHTDFAGLSDYVYAFMLSLLPEHGILEKSGRLGFKVNVLDSPRNIIDKLADEMRTVRLSKRARRRHNH